MRSYPSTPSWLLGYEAHPHYVTCTGDLGCRWLSLFCRGCTMPTMHGLVAEPAPAPVPWGLTTSGGCQYTEVPYVIMLPCPAQ
jgi:hypothetical protein